MTVPFQAYTREQWQQIMTGATKAHDLKAVQDAAAALNEYDKQSVDATRVSSIPKELGAVATGIGHGIEGIPAGLQQIAHQIGQGDVVGAGKSVLGGIGGLGKGIANAVEVGADALDPRKIDLKHLLGGTQGGVTPDYMPENERLQKMETGASTLPGLGIARAAAPAVKSAVGSLVDTGLAPIGGMLGRVAQALKSTAEKTPDLAKQAAGVTLGSADDAEAFVKKQPEAEAASQGPAGASGSTPPPPDPLDQPTYQRRAGVPAPGPSGAPQFEEGLPPSSPSRLIGPQASNFDIETYLRQLQKAITSGYGPQ